MDIARSPDVIRKKKIRRALYAGAALVVIVLITVGVSRLKPAAPTVEKATVWIDTVKRGDMIRQVRGSGTLIPEDIRWIAATTQGRVERIVLRPGAVAAGVEAESRHGIVGLNVVDVAPVEGIPLTECVVDTGDILILIDRRRKRGSAVVDSGIVCIG